MGRGVRLPGVHRALRGGGEVKVLGARFAQAERAALEKFIKAITVKDAVGYGLTENEHKHLVSAAGSGALGQPLTVDLAESVLHAVFRLVATSSQVEHTAAGLTRKQCDLLYALYEDMQAFGFSARDPHASLA